MAWQQERPTIRQRIKQFREKGALTKETSPIPSRFVVAPPSTIEGYQMQLVDNLPPQILPPRQFKQTQRRIDTFREGQNGRGAWDAYKVNIVSAHVVTPFTENGKQQVIQYTTAPTTYFQLRAGVTKEMPYEEARKLSHAGVSAIAITGDGKIILSTRPDNVNLYPRTITATASGSLEGEPQTSIPKKPDGSTNYASLPLLIPPTPGNIKRQMQRELSEETGIPEDALTSTQTTTTLLGIAEDSQKRYRDTLWLVELPQEFTGERVAQIHTESKEINHGSNDPMAGHLIFIDATPQKVEEYLTKLHTFWDGTADRGLLAVGKMLFMKDAINQGYSPENANIAATAWMMEVDRKIKLKRQERNREVQDYITHAIRQTRRERRKALSIELLQSLNPIDRQPVREARSARREAGRRLAELQAMPKRYDPHEDPEKQGNPGVKTALEELDYRTS